MVENPWKVKWILQIIGMQLFIILTNLQMSTM